MPVGTQGTVKGVDAGRLRDTGAQMILGNTYHLALRPGDETVAALGGLHAFMGWDGPILTDSGGFQVFSLADRMKVDRRRRRVPLAHRRRAARAHARAVDRDPGAPRHRRRHGARPRRRAAERAARSIADAMRRSVRWAERCQAAATRSDQALFAIVQGGLDPELRAECAERSWRMDFPRLRRSAASASARRRPRCTPRSTRRAPLLPADRPRYLMGVGRPQDLLEGDRPRHRPVRLRDADPQRPQRPGLHRRRPAAASQPQHARDREPLEADCPCPACRHSRGYLRHLFQADEMLGPILLSIHNLTYYQRLLAGRARPSPRTASPRSARSENAAGAMEQSTGEQLSATNGR